MPFRLTALRGPALIALLVALPMMLSIGVTAAPTDPIIEFDSYEINLLSPEQAEEDIAIFQRALEAMHPGLYRYASEQDINAAIDALRDRAADGISDLDLYRELSVILTMIRCDHTKAEYPAAFTSYRESRRTHLPFQFEIVAGRMFVTAQDRSLMDDLPLNTEIVAINGTPVGDIIDTLSVALPVDGYTDYVKPQQLGPNGEVLGSGFDQFHPLFYGYSPDYTLTVRLPGSETTDTLTVRPIPFIRWRNLDGGVRSQRNFSDPDVVRYEQLDDTTAYLSVATFVNYRTPVDPERIYQPIFAAIKANGTQHLIVDLRENSGGSDDAAVGLLRFLLDAPFTPMRSIQFKPTDYDDLTPYLASWTDTSTDPGTIATELPNGWWELNPEVAPLSLTEQPPHPAAFTGDVTVLVGHANASGVTNLLSILQDRGRVRLVGEPTGGSAEGPTAGIINFLTLPHSGITVRVPLYRQYNNITNFDPGLGITPDVIVPVTVEDYLAGRDAALIAAREQ